MAVLHNGDDRDRVVVAVTATPMDHIVPTVGAAAAGIPVGNPAMLAAAGASAAVAAGDGGEDHRKVLEEFMHLQEKSRQLFNGLRDLPPHGRKQWQGYFGRTFDVFTRLWKFQQRHRALLDSTYSLKRWQIGEIASKIGQLYYHYYLRTSETNYLTEAYSFYSAIRMRGYYSLSVHEERPDIMVKKLRYYARFIVVCLLLKKVKVVKDLVRELARHIDEYTASYEPDDQLEWALVLAEIKAFIDADSVTSVLDSESNAIILSNRINPLITPPLERSPIMCLALQEVIIVGAKTEQVKFSELTLDMFRMLQTVEREPQENMTHFYDTSPGNLRMPLENDSLMVPKRENPLKYLLYKPTVSQFLVFMSAGHRELPANGAILLYVSADGCFSTQANPEDVCYDFGGVLLSTKKEHDAVESVTGARSPHVSETNCLHPGDLLPFTRRPLFVIVDSDNSSAFSAVPRLFDQPLVVLMSPEENPAPFREHVNKVGSLYTLFLHSPLSAFCYLTSVVQIPIHVWDKCLSYIDRFMTEASRLVTSRGARDDSAAFLHFMGDDFLRLLVCRHIFASVVLRYHRTYKGREKSLPSSFPALTPKSPSDVLDNPTLQRHVVDLAAQLNVEHHFVDCGQID